ncbi:MAG: cytochrome-c peroxidase [Gammaproteobacteria bacterium]|nr:cytochrome-c peroxidase [Gammaproteobacteria bacterium]
MKIFKLVIITNLLFTLNACNWSKEQIQPNKKSVSQAQIKATVTPEEMLNKDLLTLIIKHRLTGDPTIGRELPSIDEPLAQLGAKLFFTKALSGNLDVACVSCHHPSLGGGDNLALSIGVDAEIPDLLGPGRRHSSAEEFYDGGPTVPRNAPTTFNLGLWDKVLFHDGRVESLGGTPNSNGDDGQGIRTPDVEFGMIDINSGANLSVAQARFPVTSAQEMKNFDHFGQSTNSEVRMFLAQRVGLYGLSSSELAENSWLSEFRDAFEEPEGIAEELITFANITNAIAFYENSQVFVNTPWKEFINGKVGALSLSAKRGARLFYATVENGGAACVSCHTGDFFTDEKFYNLAMPQIGRGKGDGSDATNDFGRYRETKVDSDKFSFRTPTLLNVEVTGPWTHAGAYNTLNAVVKHHLNPESSITNYDWSSLSPNIQAHNMTTNTKAALDELQKNGENAYRIIPMSDNQVTDIVSFLKSLTDPCVKDRECLSKWIPDASDTNPDGLRLNAIDKEGAFL